ncbi:hypothetical protein BJ508DRAFT_365033 [Ascobolus immersus RN42]|uniref:Uncharacterized protein n=1 Tax=Ascobolus immersus RN42 TaxID=1160509 RepID=A0A3N4HT34_ASCIM|nr:hypothetical protein BJ508DRAFT_365033 [Ascobolus immersus RN42]
MMVNHDGPFEFDDRIYVPKLENGVLQPYDHLNSSSAMDHRHHMLASLTIRRTTLDRIQDRILQKFPRQRPLDLDDEDSTDPPEPMSDFKWMRFRKALNDLTRRMDALSFRYWCYLSLVNITTVKARKIQALAKNMLAIVDQAETCFLRYSNYLLEGDETISDFMRDDILDTQLAITVGSSIHELGTAETIGVQHGSNFDEALHVADGFAELGFMNGVGQGGLMDGVGHAGLGSVLDQLAPIQFGYGGASATWFDTNSEGSHHEFVDVDDGPQGEPNELDSPMSEDGFDYETFDYAGFYGEYL